MHSLADELRRRGLRVTRPRLAVLEVLAGGGHLDVDQIATQVRARLESVSTQAVYDVLGALARAGLARRIEPAGSPARYEARTGDNHHHVVCRGCGRVADVDCAVGAAPCLDPSNSHGFLVDEAEVTFWGLCQSCQELRCCDAPSTPDRSPGVTGPAVAVPEAGPAAGRGTGGPAGVR